jgi:D-alanyl-lipoteichoic acid acyltransferase DltB (MBOAT superfamily)
MLLKPSACLARRKGEKPSPGTNHLALYLEGSKYFRLGTIVLLLAALSIFVWLAAQSKNIRSFQLQISIFIIIWVLGGVAYTLQDSGIIVVSPLQGDIGLEIHVISVAFLSIMIWLRFYYSQRSRKRLIEAQT